MGEKGIKIRDVEHLKELLSNSPVPIKSAFLFGSRARGDYLEESDWDLMIISPEFAGIPFPERATMLVKKFLSEGLSCCAIPRRNFRKGQGKSV